MIARPESNPAGNWRRRVRAIFEAVGSSDGRLYLVARAVRALSFGAVRVAKYVIAAQPVLNSDVTPARRGRSIMVRELATDEIRHADFGRPAHVIEQRIQQGCRCITAHLGDSLVGFQWFTLEDYLEDEFRCLFVIAPHDRAAWDFDIVVAPHARTLPVFARLWDECNRELRDARVEMTVSRIDALNAASRRAHARLGAVEVASVFFVSLGGMQLSVLPAPPWLHLSISSNQIPRICASALARKHLRGVSAKSGAG